MQADVGRCVSSVQVSAILISVASGDLGSSRHGHTWIAWPLSTAGKKEEKIGGFYIFMDCSYSL